jgi:hypothetical protein
LLTQVVGFPDYANPIILLSEGWKNSSVLTSIIDDYVVTKNSLLVVSIGLNLGNTNKSNIYLYINGKQVAWFQSNNSQDTCQMVLPVKEGDVIKCTYTGYLYTSIDKGFVLYPFRSN